MNAPLPEPRTPMDILYLNFDRGIPVLGEKGASVHVRSMVTAFAALGHHVTLCCTQAGAGNAPPPCHLVVLASAIDDTVLSAECTMRGVADLPSGDALVRRELGRLALDRVLPSRVGDAIASAGINAPHLIYERHALFHTAGVALARRFGVPRILEVNAPLVQEQARYRGLALREAAEAAERLSYAGADLIVAVSDAVARHVIAEGADPARVMVAQNGADTASFRPNPAQGDAIRALYGLQNDIVAGFVGSFKAWHGFDLLLTAFEELLADYPSARLLAVGNGPMLDAARNAAAGLGGRVVFTGDVPHAAIPSQLAAMDFTVAPYLAQPDFYFSPLKIVESMAAGRPVVAPRLGQIESLIAHGKTGLLYAPDDPRACADAMAAMLDNKPARIAMGQAAARHAETNWDWARIAARILRRACLAPAQ
jgi:glycosyltransferase involved in cell wall biosynthesis